MPLIQAAPPKPATTLGTQTLGQQTSGNLSPARPQGISQTPPAKRTITTTPPSPSAVKIHGAVLVQTISGVKRGSRPAHVVEVLDLSVDKTQVYPFLDHCDTCGFESRQDTLPDAVSVATNHVTTR